MTHAEKPEYKLTFFDFRGRAEVTRLLFKLAGKQFEDVRIKEPRELVWPAMKETLPLGKLPVLELKDGRLVEQSYVIARFVARELNLCGSNNWEQAVCDMIVDTEAYIAEEAVRLKFGPVEAKEIARGRALDLIPAADKLLKTHRKGRFILGDKPSLADAVIFATVEFLKQAVNMTVDGTAAEITEEFAKIPQIAEWLKTRPDHPY